MDYQYLEKTAMCYRCVYKEMCKTVYQADDLGIQQSKWNCPEFTEEMHQGGWIPVSERLPEYEGTFLVTDIEGKIYIEDFRFQICDKTQSYWSGMKVVVAWQPLPEPYEK